MIQTWYKIEKAITIACAHYNVDWKDMVKNHYKVSRFNNYKAMVLSIGLLWKDMGYLDLMNLFRISQGTVYDMYRQFKHYRARIISYVQPIYEYKYYTSLNYFNY